MIKLLVILNIILVVSMAVMAYYIKDLAYQESYKKQENEYLKRIGDLLYTQNRLLGKMIIEQQDEVK